jgi:NADPH:quinone reductase-like Zn-dependent oxidoreductase
MTTVAIMTAAIGLYQRLKLPLPSATPTQQHTWIAINGASSSVGSFALQLAKLSGLKVLATAGVSSNQVRALGADEILDYRTLNLDDLAHHFRTKHITHVFDAASTEASQKLLAAALQANGGGELAVVLAPPKLDADRVNVEPLVRVGTSYTTERTFATEWYATFGRWLNEGVIKPNKVRLMPNGLVRASLPGD